MEYNRQYFNNLEKRLRAVAGRLTTTEKTLASSTPVSSNDVLVTDESDFPTPSGGISTLAANTVYTIEGDLTISFSIDLNNSAIIGKSFIVNNLTYTPASGAMFVGDNGGHLENLTIASNGGGTAEIFDLDASLNPDQLFFIRNCTIGGADPGQIEGYALAQFQLCLFLSNTVKLTFTDITTLSLNSVAFLSSNTATTYIDFNGTYTKIIILGGTYDTANIAFDVTGITITDGVVSGAFFTGGGTFITGSPGIEWDIQGAGIDTFNDNVSEGDLYVSTPVETVITTINTPVKVLGTTTTGELFRVGDDSGTNNRLEYLGGKTKKFRVDAHLSVSSAANNKEFTWYFAKNGAVITESGIKRKQGTGADIGALGLSWIIELATNDYVELWVENNTDDTNVTLEKGVFSIS